MRVSVSSLAILCALRLALPHQASAQTVVVTSPLTGASNFNAGGADGTSGAGGTGTGVGGGTGGSSSGNNAAGGSVGGSSAGYGGTGFGGGGGGGAGGQIGNQGNGAGGGGGLDGSVSNGSAGGGAGGGVGTTVTAGSWTNNSSVSGAYGGNGGNGAPVMNSGGGGGGGAGVYASGSGSGSVTLINNAGAAIRGGFGGEYAGFGVNTTGIGGGGGGGTGVAGSNFTLTNAGTIAGGGGGYGYTGGSGGNGVGGTNFNLSNSGNVTGGNGYNGSLGGTGVAGSGFTLTNSGTIAGGLGGGSGGSGVAGSGFTLTNSGTITGGNGNYFTPTPTGGNGGTGVTGSGFSLTNTATVTGGNGSSGFDFDSGNGGNGGSGVAGSSFTLANSGAITGGNGGNGGDGGDGGNDSYGQDSHNSNGNGGHGGGGVTGSGFTLTNTGTITGGDGGSGDGDGKGIDGSGGVGVTSTGGSTIVTSGQISGGVSAAGVQADAVDLSGGGNTLKLESGYGFTGNVVSTSGTTNGGDTLELGGTANGTFNLSQIVTTTPTSWTGTVQYSGFDRFLVTDSAVWTLTGSTNAVSIAASMQINNGATLQFDNGAAGISLAGTFTDNGILTIGGSAAAASLAGTGTANLAGILTLTNAADRFSGTIQGTGGLTIAGGNETLTGANTYSGGTTIEAGTLTVGSNTALGTGVLDMAQGTALAFGTNGLTLGNAIVLNGDPTVEIDSGTDTLAGTISDGATPGDLVKTGAGTLVLAGNSTYSGGTEVAAGTLQVDGAIASPVTVDTAGTLAGAGTIGTTTVSGTLAPGDAGVGTLHVNGNLTMAAGSTYQVDVTPAAALGHVAVTGAATLQGGTVAVTAGAGNWTTTRYTILTAGGGVTGQFAGVLTNLAFLTPTLAYDSDDVFLSLRRNTLDFAGVATTRNEVAAGNGLSGTTSGALYDALVQTDAATARHALNSLSGELHASARTALVQDSYYVRDAAVERLRGVECAPGAASGMKTAAGGKPTDGACQPDRASVWMQDYGSFGHNGGNGNAAGMGHSVGGFVLGADAPVLGWQVGGLVGYGHSSFDSGAVSSYGHSSNVSLGLYAGTHWGRLALRTGATYSWNMLSTTRNVGFTGFSNRLNTDYDGGTAQAFGDLGYRLDAGPAMIEPFANVAYVNLHTNGYIEHGGPAALAGRAMDTGVTYSTFGARFAGTVRVGGVALTPNATLGYRHAFGLTTPTTREAFLAGGNAFDVAGVPLSTDAAVLKAGLQAKLTDRLNVGLSYVGQYGDHSTDSGLTGNVKVTF
ncbi:autotransporter domain-containing protein [Gluconacetobacter diazotrophicus]|uniref:Autotransporter domain-containing protein n=1 Tax=Gluconacetobacter diazotrophicus TaxID=33996 RepID=A0A7W4I6T0_GLUDI|nr:autotransporter domain-containing protein [Gluconacetobacter diazotrophicus]MBB2157329.1 autotransporter domain-containing protein [Gluconacetobacter diazotrophicus]